MKATLLLLVAALAAEPATGVDVLLSTADAPTRLRIEIVGDPSPVAAHREFIERLVSHFDRDGDGALDEAEAARVISLPVEGGAEAKLDFRRLDADANGRGSVDETVAYYLEIGFWPIVARIRPPDASRVALSDALFAALDRDSDDFLTSKELSAADRLTRRFDENENEILEADELLSGASGDASPVGPSTDVAIAADDEAPDAVLVLAIGEDQTTVRPVTPGASAAPDSEPHVFDSRGGSIVADPAFHSGAARFRTAKGFYVALFTEALGSREGLRKVELEGDPNLRALAEMFDAADRDGDGTLTTTELEGFLALVESGIAGRTSVTIDDRGADLFALVDADADERIDQTELRRVADMQPLSRSAVPRRYRVEVGHAATDGRFGPAPVPKESPRRSAASKTRAAVELPRWLRSMDRTKDGFVSEAEFLGSPARFREFDRNGDGRISVDEAK